MPLITSRRYFTKNISPDTLFNHITEKEKTKLIKDNEKDLIIFGLYGDYFENNNIVEIDNATEKALLQLDNEIDQYKKMIRQIKVTKRNLILNNSKDFRICKKEEWK